MVKVFKNNKILFIVTAIVLICGASLAVILISSAEAAKTAQTIKTAETEAVEQMALAAETKQPSHTVEPTAVTGELSARALASLVSDREFRRDYVIPAIDTVYIVDAKTWKQAEPEDSDSVKAAAYDKCAQIAKGLFNYEMNSDYSISHYTDNSKHRADFIQIKTNDDALVCTLTADELELINIDYYFIPKGAPINIDTMGEYFPAEVMQTADFIAAMFGAKVSDVRFAGGGGYPELTRTIYSIITDNGMFIDFAVTNGELAAVSVYPSEASMQECVYFDADVQRDPSLVQMASPQDFKEGEPGEGDMTRDEAQSFYISFLNNANGIANYDAPVMTFYIDNSGKRENYWHMEGNLLTMDIASKSKWILSMKCGKLWNPEFDLTGIEYASMGGREYETYLGHLMSSLYGDGFLLAGVNAVGDGHYCTEDAWMTDGTVYEFSFEDGKLTEAYYFFNDEYFRYCLGGWQADNLYINSSSGEEFIPER